MAHRRREWEREYSKLEVQVTQNAGKNKWEGPQPSLPPHQVTFSFSSTSSSSIHQGVWVCVGVEVCMAQVIHTTISMCGK